MGMDSLGPLLQGLVGAGAVAAAPFTGGASLIAAPLATGAIQAGTGSSGGGGGGMFGNVLGGSSSTALSSSSGLGSTVMPLAMGGLQAGMGLLGKPSVGGTPTIPDAPATPVPLPQFGNVAAGGSSQPYDFSANTMPPGQFLKPQAGPPSTQQLPQRWAGAPNFYTRLYS